VTFTRLFIRICETRKINSLDSPAAGSHPGQAATPSPLDLAVVAMARFQVGQTADAQAAVQGLRKLVETDRWANDREARGFLKEAEEIASGQKANR